ncbi:C40 family peptidase [Frankia sp. CIT1]|uniref:C40 family peptidase n=1 Tax=Frankia sp. CIT1 TaxID=2880974 RepID=UPI001EF72F25|nr:C40 family peptidase [Frankia sp. CIT1]
MRAQGGGHEIRHLVRIMLAASMAVYGLGGSEVALPRSVSPPPLLVSASGTADVAGGSGLSGGWARQPYSTLRANLSDLVQQADATPGAGGDQLNVPGLARWRTVVRAQDVAGLGPSAQARAALLFALSQLGRPYEWGAQGPDSYDCSGLTQRAFATAGILIPRVAADQARVGQAVRLAELLPGDLVFYAYDTADPATIHHVAMYVGGGLVIHAPQTGDVVRITPLWLDGYIGAVRLSRAIRGTGITTVGPFTVPPPPAGGAAVDPLVIPPLRKDPGGGVVAGEPPTVAPAVGQAGLAAGLPTEPMSTEPMPTGPTPALMPTPGGSADPTPTPGDLPQPRVAPSPSGPASAAPEPGPTAATVSTVPAAAPSPAASPAVTQPASAASPAPAATGQPTVSPSPSPSPAGSGPPASTPVPTTATTATPPSAAPSAAATTQAPVTAG